MTKIMSQAELVLFFEVSTIKKKKKTIRIEKKFVVMYKKKNKKRVAIRKMKWMIGYSDTCPVF